MKSLLSRCLKSQSQSGEVGGVESHDLDVTLLARQKNSGSTVLCAVSCFQKSQLSFYSRSPECAVETVFMEF